MKTRLNFLKFLMIAFGLSAALSSCSDYLNIDRYFDDEFKIDSLFSQRRYVEDYMWGTAAMFPDEANLYSSTNTPGPLATDLFVSLSDPNEWRGMAFVLGQVTAADPKFDTWANMYKIIRKCNLILANIDAVPNITTSEYLYITGYTRFIRAYAYYKILVDYGPPVLLGDEILPVNESPEYYATYQRSTYDEAVEYICFELEEAAKNLPAKVGNMFFGRPHKGAAYGLVARIRLIHASPAFNGGAAATNYFGNWTRKTDGVHYVAQTADNRRWAIAAAAAKRVIDMEIDGIPAYKLHTVAADNRTPVLPAGVTTDPEYYEPFPVGAAGIDPYHSYSDIFTAESPSAVNPEYVWGKTAVENNGYTGPCLNMSFPRSLGGFQNVGVTQKAIDAFSMIDGSSIETSPLYSETGFSSPVGFSGYQFGSSVFNMYVNREARFYASIGFSGCFWPCLSTQENQLRNQYINYYYNNANGKAENATSFFYPATGYVLKTYIHPQDGGFNSGSSKRSSKSYGIIRYAEILLSYAEALNNLTNSYTVTLDDVTYSLSRDMNEIKQAFNQVRHRAGLPGIAGTEDVATFQKLIEKERIVELLPENNRFYDVRRWGIYEEVESVPITGMNMDADIASFFQRTIPVNPYIANRIVHKRLLFLPISRNELLRMPNVDQNPGWY